MPKIYLNTSTSLLPFLYQTRTLLARQKCLLRTDLQKPQFKQVTTGNLRARVKMLPIKRSDVSDIPFENALIHQGYNDDKQEEDDMPRKRESTITATEKAIFDRIYKTLSSPMEEKPGVEDVELDEMEDGMGGEESLESIFNAAISSQEKYGQDRGTRFHRNHEKDDSISKRALNQPTDKHSEQVEQARTLDKERVTGLLDKAVSDTGVWRVLEKEIFSRVEDMNRELKEEERLRAVAGKKQRRSKEKRERDKTKLAKDNVTHDPTPSMNVPSKETPKVSSLEILEANYASHCLKAMRIFRTVHPTSPFASALIPQMKRLGSISYVLGASTALYNEMLYMRWVHFHDVHGVATLVDEMLDHGIGIDDMTVTILQNGRKYRKMAAQGEFGQLAQGILQLQGIAAGWSKWNLALQKAYSDKAMNDQRQEEENDLDEHEAAEDFELDSLGGSQESRPQSQLTYTPSTLFGGRPKDLSRNLYSSPFTS